MLRPASLSIQSVLCLVDSSCDIWRVTSKHRNGFVVRKRKAPVSFEVGKFRGKMLFFVLLISFLSFNILLQAWFPAKFKRLFSSIDTCSSQGSLYTNTSNRQYSSRYLNYTPKIPQIERQDAFLDTLVIGEVSSWVSCFLMKIIIQ